MAMIPHSKPSLGPDDIRAVTDVLRSGQVAGGPAVSQFERGMAAYIGVQGGVAVSEHEARPAPERQEDIEPGAEGDRRKAPAERYESDASR